MANETVPLRPKAALSALAPLVPYAVAHRGRIAAALVALFVASAATLAVPVAVRGTILGVISQVKQGLGLAFIPNELMRLEPDLVWCMTPEQEISRTWLITTERLRNVARVRALLDFVVAFNNATKRSQSAEDRSQPWGV